MNLSNYATKIDLNIATDIDAYALASETDLSGLETKVVNLDVDSFKLSKISNVVDNDGVKHVVYDKLVTKVNATDIKIPSTS